MVDGPCFPLLEVDDLDCSMDQFGDDPPTDEELDDVVAAASRVAWALGGRRHGVCELTERPGRMNRRDRCHPSHAYRDNGSWFNGCGCKPASVVTLGRMPVVEVVEVRIGGDVLPSDAYRFVQPNRLYRSDGGRWPPCQLLELPDDAPDVLEVDYRAGLELDVQGRLATAELACEMLKAMKGRKCRLPDRVTSVTRQGVSFVVLDPMDFMEKGRTGVYAFDLWVKTTNPGGLTHRPRVRTPDLAIPRRS